MKRKITAARYNTTEVQHETLLGVAKTLRKEAVKWLVNGKYTRVFTEPRKNGVRTKFWYARCEKPNTIKSLCEKIVQEKYNGMYTVEVKTGHSYPSYPSLPSVSIFIRFK